MKKLLSLWLVLLVLFSYEGAIADPNIYTKNAVASGNSSAAGITIGTSIITGGTDKRVLFDDAGVVGESAGLTYTKGTGNLSAVGFTALSVTELAPALTAGNWTVGAGWESPIVGPGLIKNADGTGTQTPSAATNIVANTTYKVTITLSAASVGSATYTVGGVAGASTLSAATTYTDYVTTSSTGKLIITPTNTSRFTISAISILAVGDFNGTTGVTKPAPGFFTTITGTQIWNDAARVFVGTRLGVTRTAQAATSTEFIVGTAGPFANQAGNSSTALFSSPSGVQNTVQFNAPSAANNSVEFLVNGAYQGRIVWGTASSSIQTAGNIPLQLYAGTNTVQVMENANSKYLSLQHDGTSGIINSSSGGVKYNVNTLAVSPTAPTLASGGCTSPTAVTSNGTAAFSIGVGTSCSGSQPLVFTLPAATTGWMCTARNSSNAASSAPAQTGAVSTTSVTITSFSRTLGTAQAWVDSDNVVVSCMGY